MSNQFVFVEPRVPIAGCAVVVAKRNRLQAIHALQSAAARRRYVARGYVTDQVCLTGNITDVMATQAPKLVKLQESPLSIYLHPGGDKAIFYDLSADSDGYLSHIEVEVEGTFPGDVLGPARTAINNMLDKLVGRAWTPLSIGRLELRLKTEPEPLAYQFLMPFSEEGILLERFGGMDDIPFFGPYESLIREAVTSSSPFYRFLCAYRLYEGVGELRRAIRQVREKAGVHAKLPSDPSLDLDMLKNLGASATFLAGLRTVQDLHVKFTTPRNQVAHFLLKGAQFVVSTSDGDFYRDYSTMGAVLLHYGHRCLVDLRLYCVNHLDEKVRIGEVLPLIENRDQFIVRTR